MPTSLDTIQFQTLANSLSQMIFCFDVPSKAMWYNQAWVKYIGETPESLAQWNSFIDATENPGLIAKIEHIFKTGLLFEEVISLKNRNGIYNHFFCKITSVKSPEGRNLSFQGILAVATKSEVEDYFLNRERLALAADAADLGIWEFDISTGTSLWSDRLKKIFGFSPEEFTGTFEQVNERIHPDDRELVASAAFANRDDNSRYSAEFRIQLPDGSIRWLMTLGKTFSDKKGVPTKLAGVTFDITARKKIEADLREALASRDEFLSIAAHEINTPLTALGLQFHLLQKWASEADVLANAKFTKTLQDCQGQLLRFTKLTTDLLDVSRVRSGKFSLEKSEMNLTELIERTVRNYDSKFIKANCEIKLQLEPNLVGRWDPIRLEQVIVNLLSNAMKFGADKPIEITAKKQGNKAVIQITDHGFGIAPADQERIFKRFERAVPMQNFGGLGLGLFIAQTIVAAHDGKIMLQSELGQGATFTVELPF